MGGSASVYAVYKGGILVIGKVASKSESRLDGIDVFIADDKKLNADFAYKEDNINESIDRFFML